MILRGMGESPLPIPLALCVILGVVAFTLFLLLRLHSGAASLAAAVGKKKFSPPPLLNDLTKVYDTVLVHNIGGGIPNESACGRCTGSTRVRR